MAAPSLSPGAIALNRFGLGARPEDLPPADPARALKDQFARFEITPAPFATLPDARAALQGWLAARKQAPQAPATAIRALYQQEIGARMASARATPAPFVERMVHFWSNHFAVSADNTQVMALAGAFEREAIRPHVLGRFETMLQAVERHPAMLVYLSQVPSTGPHSPASTRAAAAGRKAPGLNENLAREIMELHTLGVRSGYTQADVTELARAMTGWTLDGLGQPGTPDGTVPIAFRFRPARHEPGPRTIMGRTYPPGTGESQAAQAFTTFAHAPQTATHIATKMARHFAGDTPPPALVERLSRAFTQGRGDLPVLYAALIDSPEVWAPVPLKFKTPWDWLVSALRGLDTDALSAERIAGMLEKLSQPVWKPGSPAGWDDTTASWAASNALLRRVEIAQRLASQTPRDPAHDARRLAPLLLPGACAPATLAEIARAESPASALALLLVSPDFLRR